MNQKPNLCPCCGAPLFPAFQSKYGNEPMYFVYCLGGTKCKTFDDEIIGKGETIAKAMEDFQLAYGQKQLKGLP